MQAMRVNTSIPLKAGEPGVSWGDVSLDWQPIIKISRHTKVGRLDNLKFKGIGVVVQYIEPLLFLICQDEVHKLNHIQDIDDAITAEVSGLIVFITQDNIDHNDDILHIEGSVII